MKYLISYECKNGDCIFSSEFEFEAEMEPAPVDQILIDEVRKHSSRFFEAGALAVTITSIDNFNLR